MIMFKYNTKVSAANLNSKTLRSSIPKEIVKLLKVKAGDSIEWNVDVIDNNTFQITVTKKE
jgi:antitoxin component of MazEF toxin-antitoxin module